MASLEQISGFALTPDQFNALLSQLSPDLGLTRTESGLYIKDRSVYRVMQNETYPDVHVDASDILLSSTIMKLAPKCWKFILASVISSRHSKDNPSPNLNRGIDSSVLLYTEDQFGRAIFEAIKTKRTQLTCPANQPYV